MHFDTEIDSSNLLSDFDEISEVDLTSVSNYCKKLHDSCSLFYNDGTPYIFYVSIFSDPIPSTISDNNVYYSVNVSILEQKILLILTLKLRTVWARKMS